MKCIREECDKEVHCKGLCQPHYRQAKRRERGLKKPGKKPDPSRPRSRYASPREPKQREIKTHCTNGHEFTEENTYLWNGSQHCRTCQRERMRERRPATGIGAGGRNKAKTHCPQGHEYTEENTWTNKDGRRSCRICSRENSKLQNYKRYGITPEQFCEMLDVQDNKCKICNDVFKDRRRIHIDHDHNCCGQSTSCGKCIRGLLCNDCNHGLGRFKDNVKNLESAIQYLQEYADRMIG